MKIAQIHTHFYSIPESWNELTGRQLIKILQVLHGQQSSEYILLRLFKIITGISRWRLFWLPTYEIADNLYLVEYLLQSNTLTENILPVYKGLFGPKKNFDNLLICEFVFTEAYYMQYIQGPDTTDFIPAQWLALKKEKQAALNTLIAILYRPAKKHYNRNKNVAGDVRQSFNDALTGYFAAKIARWPEAVKTAIVHWYAGCRLQLIRDFPVVFESSPSAGESTYGLWSVMRSVAEKGTFGDFAMVEKQFVKTIMMELTESIKESQRLENSIK